MNTVRESAAWLADLVPYDPKYLPADAMMSANENPCDIDEQLKAEISEALGKLQFNRYPDPLANELRDMIAQANGLERNQVLLGNGGDELLFNLALTYGGPGRTFLNLPPTFSVYEYNALLTNTAVVNIPRKDDYTIDEQAVIDRVAQGDIDYVVVTSPNNPTGCNAPRDFLIKLLEASDALIMVDEAYFEFSRESMVPYLGKYENLLILRTFSKAYSLAGVRLGYLLGSPKVIREFMKVRQPYSVDAVSQEIGKVIYRHREQFHRAVDGIIEQRGVLMQGLQDIPGVTPYPSDSNYILFKVANAGQVWQELYDRSILVRDFSRSKMLEDTLRVSVGTPQQNQNFLSALRDIVTA